MEKRARVKAAPAAATVLRIKDWIGNFETHRTRALKRMEWVRVPNKMDGVGYRKLAEHTDGAAHFGVWLALIEIASRCPVRGTLQRDGLALTAGAIATITGFSEHVIEAAIARLTSAEVGWIEIITVSAIRRDPAHSAVDQIETRRDPAHSAVLEKLIRRDPAHTAGLEILNARDPAHSATLAARPGDRRNGMEWNGNTEQTTSTQVETEFCTVEEKPSSVSKTPEIEKPNPRPPADRRPPAREILNPQRIDGMRRILRDYMGMYGTDTARRVSPPDDGIVTACLTTIGDTPLGEAAAFLRKLYQGGQSPRHASGPKSYAWFVTVFEAHYGPQDGGAARDYPATPLGGSPLDSAIVAGILRDDQTPENDKRGETDSGDRARELDSIAV